MKHDKVPAAGLNFEKLFQDNLPAEATDLRDFLKKYKEKDEGKEFDIKITKNAAFDKLNWAKTFIPGNERISAWMLADTEVYNSYRQKQQKLGL